MDEILYNLKLTTTVKNELLKDIGSIFDYSSQRDKKEELTQTIGSCFLELMILCRRYGIDMKTVNSYMMDRINTGILDGHMCETKFGDLSKIANYIRGD